MEAMALSAFFVIGAMYEFPYILPYLVIFYIFFHSLSSIQLTCTQ